MLLIALAALMGAWIAWHMDGDCWPSEPPEIDFGDW